MQAAHFYKKNSKKQSAFPRSHLVASAIILSLTVTTFISMPNSSRATENPKHVVVPIELNFEEPQLAQELTAVESEREHKETEVTISDLPDEPNWESINISKGDTLKSLFSKAGIPNNDYKLIRKAGTEAIFKNFDKGHRLVIKFNDNREINSLKFKKSLLETYTFTRKENTFSRKDAIREPQVRSSHKVVSMNGSLSNSLTATDKNLDTSSIRKQLSQALSGQVNLRRARKDDKIHLLVEEKFIDGQSLGFGNVQAIQYDAKNKDYTTYRYTSRTGDVHFYSPNVDQRFKTVKQPTDDYFLSNPVPGSRISSHYSNNRFHPVLRRYRAHKGTDFAAPRGTPIKATADGRVSVSSRSGGNGNYVVIKHGSRFTTKYLHMTHRYVRPGEYVKRGQTIGTVGSTGLANGPHLHYEFLVNNQHKNPLHVGRYTPKSYREVEVAVNTPGAIPQEERKRFFDQTRGVRLQFANLTRGTNSHVADAKTAKQMKLAQNNKPYKRNFN